MAQFKRDQKNVSLATDYCTDLFPHGGVSMRGLTLALYIVQVCISLYKNGYNLCIETMTFSQSLKPQM